MNEAEREADMCFDELVDYMEARAAVPNPVDAIRDLLVAASGRQVNTEAFQVAFAYCNQPVGEGVREMKNGDHVIFVNALGVEHDALLTAIHGDGTAVPSVNVVFVLQGDNMRDGYGQQISRESSVVHQGNQGAEGMYWRKP